MRETLQIATPVGGSPSDGGRARALKLLLSRP